MEVIEVVEKIADVPLLYLFPDIVGEFLCSTVLFVGQLRCHFGRPYCTSALLAHDNLPTGHMLEKKICTLHGCLVFLPICCGVLFLCLYMMLSVALSRKSGREGGCNVDRILL